MSDYRRCLIPGGCYFFTVNLLQRYPNDLLIRHIGILRDVVRNVRFTKPFFINAWVVMPDHMHCIWTLPQGDSGFSARWRLIKSHFSKGLPAIERRSTSRLAKNERGIWQRRFWEHVIRDEHDFEVHMNYIHYNPVKHGYVRRVIDWPYSTFHRAVERGIYSPGWGGDGVEDIDAGEAV